MMDDPRFDRAVALFNEGDYFDASELFEELFFEAVRDEVEFTRVFLQVSTGMHHIERGQARAAIERLEEGLIAMEHAGDAGGLRDQVERVIEQLKQRQPVTRPKIRPLA